MTKKGDSNIVEPAVTTPEPEVPSTPDYGKQIEDLQKTIKEQGDTIGTMQEFVSGASVVINTIAAEPTLKESFQNTLKRKYGVQGEQPQQGQEPNQGYRPPNEEDTEVTRKVDDVVSSQREAIIRDFEATHQIDNTDSGKGQRQKVAEYLSGFGWSVKDLPLTSLRESLEKAWTGSVGIEKLREEGKLEGITQAMTNNMGMVGSFGGGAPQASDQMGELNPKQKEWLKKLRVDEDGAKKLYNERETETEREKPTK